MAIARLTPVRRDVLLGLLLAGALALTFASTLHNQPLLDDPWVTTQNPYAQSLRGLPALLTRDVWSASASGEPSSFYRPVFMSSFLWNRLLLGNSKESYHAGNILLHVAAVLLLWRLLLAVDTNDRRHPLVAWGTALWFGITPLNSEAVNWIAARCDPLGASFALMAMLAHRARARWGHGAAVLACAAAIGTKESFALLPVILLTDDVLVLRRPLRVQWPKYAGIAAVVALYLAARRLVGVPSASVLAGTGASALLQSFAYLLIDYPLRAFLPTRLDRAHTYFPLPHWGTALALTTALGACLVIGLLLRRRPESARVRTAALGLVWFLTSLAPVALTGPNLRIIGDRYAYFPMMGVSLVVASAAGAIADVVMREGRAALAIAAGTLALAYGSALATRTVRRSHDWHDDETLAHSALHDDPDNYAALLELGDRRARQGHLDDAEAMLLHAEAVAPWEFRIHNGLCFVWLNRNRLKSAELECRRSLAINGANPRAWVNLASVYSRASLWDAGLDAATRAVALKDRYAEAHYLRAVCLANLGRIPEAVGENTRAIEIDPSHAGARSLESQFRARGLLPP